MCIAGCGDDGGARKLPDAPEVPDGPAPDMLAAGTVNVTTMSRCCTATANTPEPNILVVAVNSDGTLAGTAMTDADGKASLPIREGATVTAVYLEDADHDTDIHSFVGVKPNDNLTFGDGYFSSSTTDGASGQMTLNWTAQTGASQYRVHTPCGGYLYTAGLTYSPSLASYCQTATAPILVEALDANYQTISSAYLPAAAFTVGATVNITAGQWVTQTPLNIAASMSGLASVVTSVRFDVTADYGPFTVNSSDSVAPKSGAGSVMVSLPSTAPKFYVEARVNRNGNYGDQYYYKTGAPPLTLAATSIPWISDRAIINPLQNRVVWFETPGTYDAANLFLEWSKYDGKTYHYFNWSIIAPPNVADFTLGAPPAELAAFLPTADDFVDADLQLIDLSSASGYDAVRALPEWRTTNAFSAVLAGDEPTAAIASDNGGGEGVAFAH